MRSSSFLSHSKTTTTTNALSKVEWRNNKARYSERVAALSAKTLKFVPPHVKIPHPDSNPEEHRKQVEKIRLTERPMELDEFRDFMEEDPDYFGEEEDFDD